MCGLMFFPSSLLASPCFHTMPSAVGGGFSWGFIQWQAFTMQLADSQTDPAKYWCSFGVKVTPSCAIVRICWNQHGANMEGGDRCTNEERWRPWGISKHMPFAVREIQLHAPGRFLLLLNICALTGKHGVRRYLDFPFSVGLTMLSHPPVKARLLGSVWPGKVVVGSSRHLPSLCLEHSVSEGLTEATTGIQSPVWKHDSVLQICVPENQLSAFKYKTWVCIGFPTSSLLGTA